METNTWGTHCQSFLGVAYWIMLMNVKFIPSFMYIVTFDYLDGVPGLASLSTL